MWIQVEENRNSNMSPPIRIKEAFVQEAKKIHTVPKLSKSLTAFLATVQIVFGFNFGYIKQINNRYKTAAQCVSVFMGFVVMGASVISLFSEPIFIMDTMQYTLNFALLLPVKFTLHDFLSGLRAVSESFMKRNNFGICIWIYTILILCFRFVIVTIFMNYQSVVIQANDNSFDMRLCANYLAVLALEILPIAKLLMFYCLYNTLKDLKLGIISSEIRWGRVLSIYKATANIFDRIRPTSDKLIAIGLLFDSPKWIISIWGLLTLQKSSQPSTLIACSFGYCLLLTIEICVPALYAEMVTAQTDEIKYIIQEELLTEYDEASEDELIELLRYMDSRPLIRKAWRLLPVDMRLPITLLSMCTTYLIVVIQFTHLYD